MAVRALVIPPSLSLSLSEPVRAGSQHGGDLNSYSGPISCPELNLVAREEEKKERKEKKGQRASKNWSTSITGGRQSQQI